MDLIQITRLRPMEEGPQIIIRGVMTMTPPELRTHLYDFLLDDGMSIWEADAMSQRATFTEAWYSATLGFTHNCADHPEMQECAGNSDRALVLVTNFR